MENFWQNNQTKIFWILLTIYFLIGLFHVFWGNFWIDEGWYFGSSSMISQGQIPYVDFFAHHSPFVYYFYALPQLIFGTGLIVGRLTSLLLMLGIFVLIWQIVKKICSGWWPTVSALILIANFYNIYYFTTFSYRVLEAFLMTGFFWSLIMIAENKKKYALSALFLILAIGTRYPIDFLSILAAIYILLVSFEFKSNREVLIPFWSTIVITLGVIFGPFLILNYKNFIFGTVEFPFKDVSWLISFGIMKEQDLLHKIFRIFANLAGAIKNFLVVIVLMTVGLVAWFKKDSWKRLKGNLLNPLYLMSFFVIANAGFLAISSNTDALYSFWNFVFPIGAILATYFLRNISEQFKIPSWSVISFMAIFCIAGLVIADNGVGSILKLKPDLDYYSQGATAIQKHSQANDRILTFTPVLAFQAKRPIVSGTIMEIYSYFPTWKDSECLEKKILNKNLLIKEIENKNPKLIVLTQKRFFDTQGPSAIFNNNRTEIMAAIEKNYSLIQTINYPDNVGQGNIYIYSKQ